MKKRFLGFVLLCCVVMLSSCSANTSTVKRPVASAFDTVVEGQKLSLYMLKNKNGMEVYLTNYGARIVAIYTPDRNGKFANVVLGYDSISQYLKDQKYTGCVVGRYANRISNGRLVLDSTYQLTQNEKTNLLHGGKSGFHKKIWSAEQKENTVIMTYLSPDKEEGFPGNLSVSITYSLNDSDELKVEYQATTDKKTVVNLSNHSYFNLLGSPDSTIFTHSIRIMADSFTPVGKLLIPTGEIASVKNTPFDFNTSELIGKRINDSIEQLNAGGGYDHNWVLRKKKNEFTLAFILSEETTGRVMTVSTNEPGLQMYCSRRMGSTYTDKKGNQRIIPAGVVLETQHFPDSPNIPSFPSTVLEKDSTYRQITVYDFSVKVQSN